MSRKRFHRYFRLGPLSFEWLPSWDEYDYPKFGAWSHAPRLGFTLRYRGWLLLFSTHRRRG